MSAVALAIGVLSLVGAVDTTTLDIEATDDLITATVTVDSTREYAGAVPEWVTLHQVMVGGEEGDVAPEWFTPDEWRSIASDIAAAGITVGALPIPDGADSPQPVDADTVVQGVAVLPRVDSWAADIAYIENNIDNVGAYDPLLIEHQRSKDPECSGAREYAVTNVPYADTATVTVRPEITKCSVDLVYSFDISSQAGSRDATAFIELLTGAVTDIEQSEGGEVTVTIREPVAEIVSPTGDSALVTSPGHVQHVRVVDSDGLSHDVDVFNDEAKPAGASITVIAATETTVSTAPQPDGLDGAEAATATQPRLMWMMISAAAVTVCVGVGAVLYRRRSS